MTNQAVRKGIKKILDKWDDAPLPGQISAEEYLARQAEAAGDEETREEENGEKIWRMVREDSNLIRYAQNELDRIAETAKTDEEPTTACEMQSLINQDMMDIVKVFCTQGHSGTTAPYVIRRVTRLLDWKPLGPLTREDDEWGDPFDRANGSQQNKRCSAVFRTNFDNSTAYYIDGKVFSDDSGKSWFTNRDSRVPVIFPYYVPDKPEYIILKEDSTNE